MTRGTQKERWTSMTRRPRSRVTGPLTSCVIKVGPVNDYQSRMDPDLSGSPFPAVLIIEPLSATVPGLTGFASLVYLGRQILGRPIHRFTSKIRTPNVQLQVDVQTSHLLVLRPMRLILNVWSNTQVSPSRRSELGSNPTYIFASNAFFVINRLVYRLIYKSFTTIQFSITRYHTDV